MNVLCMIKTLYSKNECIICNKNIILKSRPAGRSAGQSRPVSLPVSMPASAGLYAGIGRSLCRRRPVSMPASAGLYAGVGRSLCRPTPFRLCRRALRGFFSAKTASQQQQKCVFIKNMSFFCRFFLFWQMLT